MALFLVSFTSVLITVYAVLKRQLSSLFWGVLLVLFLLPHLFHSLAKDVPYAVLEEAAWFAFAFQALYLVVRVFLDQFVRLPQGSLLQKDKLRRFKKDFIYLIYLIFILGVVLRLFLLIWSGTSLTDFTWSQGLGNKTWLEIGLNYLIVVFSGAAFIAFYRKEYFFFLALTACYAIYLLVFRSRYNIIGFFVPFLVYYLLSGKLKLIFRATLIGLGVILIVFLLQQYRWVGDFEQVKEAGLSTILDNTVQYMAQGKGEFALVNAYYHFIRYDNQFLHFEEGRTYARVLLMPFPSSLIPFKVRDFAFDMYDAYYHTRTRVGTMHPTFYGDLYANFGPIGALSAVFFAAVFCLIDALLAVLRDEVKKVTLVSILGTFYVMVARGAVYNASFNALSGVILLELALFALYLLFPRLKKSLRERALYATVRTS